MFYIHIYSSEISCIVGYELLCVIHALSVLLTRYGGSRGLPFWGLLGGGFFEQCFSLRRISGKKGSAQDRSGCTETGVRIGRRTGNFCEERV